MGDRANIVIPQYPNIDEAPTGLIYLYTHWGGTDLPRTLQAALAKRWRWDDEPYLVRIIFDTMSVGDEGGETGYGISTYLGDNEHPLLVVDCTRQMVWTAEAEAPMAPRFDRTWSFDEYCTLPFDAGDDPWQALTKTG